jgi:hypothetical protein
MIPLNLFLSSRKTFPTMERYRIPRASPKHVAVTKHVAIKKEKKKKVHRGGRSDGMRAAHSARGGSFFQSKQSLNSGYERLAAAERELALRAEKEDARHRDRQEELLAAQRQARHLTNDAARDMREAKLQMHWAWQTVHGDLPKMIMSATQKNNLAVHQLVMTRGVPPIKAVERAELERCKVQASFEAHLVSLEAAAAQRVAGQAAAAAQRVVGQAAAPSFFNDRALRDDTERAAYAVLQGQFVLGGTAQ